MNEILQYPFHLSFQTKSINLINFNLFHFTFYLFIFFSLPFLSIRTFWNLNWNYFQTPENEEMAARRSEKIFVTDRSCTDLITLIILIALLGGFVS